jgi:two-component system, chemotaxis family, chemotaxis protein CheY
VRILVAEDDFISRKFLNKFLSNFGECDVAVDGLEALELFTDAVESGDLYDLVCLDIMLPEMDGLATLEALRSIEAKNGISGDRKSKVIMTTALQNEDTIFKSYELGTDAFAVKPIETSEFIKIMKEIGLDVKTD